MTLTSLELLKNTFGYAEFRPLQNEIIERVVQKRDTLVVMPTGGGKSLCYQIPALLFDGLTLVISPLISLMQDQVTQLRQLEIPAAYLNSTLSPQEFQDTAQAVREKKLKMLYMAPEGLFSERTLALLQPLEIDCIAIDEAHCISEWGHDFRPEYRQLAQMRKTFGSAVCIALTATATERVQKDIMASLEFKTDSVFVASFDRKNLFLRMTEKQDQTAQLISFLRQHPDESGIIYCYSRQQTDELSSYLNQSGYSVLPYHAGLDSAVRKENQERFVRDDVQIMVATIAFGMGIDKPNIRFIVHVDLPKNIESYYQQIGRAGRDGLDADCLLLYGYGDIAKNRYFIDQKENESERRIATLHLQAMVQLAETHVCRRTLLLDYFGETYDKDHCGKCDNCLESKELQDVTKAAQKFLSCVKRTEERFGAGHVIDVLRGSENRRLLGLGHQHLSTYGIGKEFSKQEWQYLARQFISKGLLRVDPEYGSLKLTVKAQEVLFKEAPVEVVVKPQHRQGEMDMHSPQEQEYDPKLFELLRSRRKTLADGQGVPPYVIFPDKTLMDMAARYPQSSSDMMNIFGVGAVRNKRYGLIFLKIITAYCQEHEIDRDRYRTKKAPQKDTPPKKSPRTTQIGESFAQGRSIRELQDLYKIKRSTVIRHLQDYVMQGNSLPGARLQNELDPKFDQKALQEAFDTLGARFLKPVFEHFKGKIPYEELHLQRLHYVCKRKRAD